MKILSIDIGIKNLAFCLLNVTNCDSEIVDSKDSYEILKWDIINISCVETNIPVCCEEKCNNKAKYQKNINNYCLKHAKKRPFLIANKELKKSFINKQKTEVLKSIAKKYEIVIEDTFKKPQILETINNYIANNCFITLTESNSTQVDLITIGKILKDKLDTTFNSLFFEMVIIENQISPIANRMKTIQGMVSQYFIMRENCRHIEFISSMNKLKEYNESNIKLNYSDRKKLGIKVCLEILNDNDKEFFIKHKKKDDLADSFLQGLWYIKNKLIKI
jgi:hypothetical protein